MQLTEKQKKYLRTFGHKLKPIVIIGQAGLTQTVLSEIQGGLAHHELIKVRVNTADREQRLGMINEICDQTGALLAQQIGHIALLFRANPDKKRFALPN